MNGYSFPFDFPPHHSNRRAHQQPTFNDFGPFEAFGGPEMFSMFEPQFVHPFGPPPHGRHPRGPPPHGRHGPSLFQGQPAGPFIFQGHPHGPPPFHGHPMHDSEFGAGPRHREHRRDREPRGPREHREHRGPRHDREPPSIESRHGHGHHDREPRRPSESSRGPEPPQEFVISINNGQIEILEADRPHGRHHGRPQGPHHAHRPHKPHREGPRPHHEAHEPRPPKPHREAHRRHHDDVAEHIRAVHELAMREHRRAVEQAEKLAFSRESDSKRQLDGKRSSCELISRPTKHIHYSESDDSEDEFQSTFRCQSGRPRGCHRSPKPQHIFFTIDVPAESENEETEEPVSKDSPIIDEPESDPPTSVPEYCADPTEDAPVLEAVADTASEITPEKVLNNSLEGLMGGIRAFNSTGKVEDGLSAFIKNVMPDSGVEDGLSALLNGLLSSEMKPAEAEKPEKTEKTEKREKTEKAEKREKREKTEKSEKREKREKAKNSDSKDSKKAAKKAESPKSDTPAFNIPTMSQQNASVDSVASENAIFQKLDALSDKCTLYERLFEDASEQAAKFTSKDTKPLVKKFKRIALESEKIYLALDEIRVPRELRGRKHDLTDRAVKLASGADDALIEFCMSAEVSDLNEEDISDSSSVVSDNSDYSVLSMDSQNNSDAESNASSTSSRRHRVIIEDIE